MSFADPEGLLAEIDKVRDEIERRTNTIDKIYCDFDEGAIDQDVRAQRLSDERAEIHVLALRMTSAFGELSDYLTFGGTLPDEWREARLPSF